MNAMQIRKMLLNIKADFIGMGRPWHSNDDTILEAIMQIYYQTDIIDWEECNYLFVNYLEKGILDFPKALASARKRKFQEERDELEAKIVRYAMRKIGTKRVSALDGMTLEFKGKYYNIYVDGNEVTVEEI